MKIFKLLFVAFIAVLLLYASAVLAEDTPPDSTLPLDTVVVEPAAPADSTLPTELLTAEQFNELIKGVGRSAAGGSVFLGLITFVLTQLLKKVPQFENVRAENIALGVAVLFTVIGSIAFNAGYGDAFDSSYKTLETLAPPIAQILGGVWGSGFIYNTLSANSRDKPGLLTAARTPRS